MILLTALFACTPDYGWTQETREIYIEVQDTDSFVVEGFDQPPRVEELDIAVVIDKSGSMSEELERSENAVVELHQQASTFIPDFRMMLYGIGETYTEEPAILDGAAHEVEVRAAFASIGKDDNEAAFQVIYNAMILGHEPSFYRPTSVFVISDENDASEFTPELFVDYVTVKAYAPWEFNAVTPSESSLVQGCNGDGSEYVLAATLTGGGQFDLCAESWDLFGGSQFSYEPVTSYDIAHEPVPDSIEVYYDWELVPETGWVYAHPTITFNPEPPPGSNVTIAYEVD